jgi:hypothetical protein
MTLCLRERDLDWREIDNEIVALDGQGSVYFSVSGSAAIVWRLLAGSTNRDHLITALTERYGIHPDQATGDVDAFLAELSERGLLAA